MPKTRISKASSTVQAVLFNKSWKTENARKWLKKNSFSPIKRVHKGPPDASEIKQGFISRTGTLRYRIVDPKTFKKFAFKRLGKGISFILGIK